MKKNRLILPFQAYSITDPVKQEADQICSLLAYALVYADWQPDTTARSARRGYNIGALLVDTRGTPVYFELNRVNSSENATQHGELRAITQYIAEHKCFNLEGFSIYSTLEPCIMCAGMMTMTNVDRVIYGQKDLDFSNGLERLALDSTAFGGYPPFKRTTWADPSPSPFRGQLEQAYEQYLKAGEERILAKFLAGSRAEAIFKTACHSFLSFEPKHEANRALLDAALEFYDQHCP